ncbi:MAG: lipopolysaccharide biosynthesis protein [Candidatus Avispirillum sp.]
MKKLNGNVKNSAYNAAGTIIYFFCQWLTTVLCVRLIDFTAAGIFNLAIPFSNFFSFIARFGIRNYEVSDVEHRYSVGQYFAARLICAAASVICFGIGIAVIPLTRYSMLCYALCMVFKLLEAYTDGAFSVFQNTERYDRLFISYTLKGILPTAAFGAALYFTHELLWGILLMSAAYALAALFYDIPALRSSGVGKPCFSGCMGIVKVCTPLMLVSLAIPAMNYVTRYAIRYYMDEAMVGQYSSIATVTVVMSTFTGAVWVSLIPQVSRWYVEGNRKGILSFFAKMMLACLALGAAAVGAAALLGKWAFSLVFGSEILESSALIVPVAVCAVVLMIKSFFSAMLVPLRRQNVLLWGEAAGVIVCAALAFPLTAKLGMQGANLSYIIGAAVQLIILAAASVKGAGCAGRVSTAENRD